MPNKIDVLNVGEIDYKLDASYVNGKPADEIATIKNIFSATGSNLAIWSGTTVPNSGSIRKIYINHNLTDDDVISCLAKISLDRYQIHDGNLHRYIVAKSDEMSLEVELDHENKWYGIYKTFSEFDEIMFSSHMTPKAPFSGWKDFHDVFELGGDLDTYIEDKEIGTENDVLSSLFSAAPFKESRHSFYLSETDGKLYQKSEGKLVEVGKSSIIDVDTLPDSESLYAPVPMGEYIESIFLNKSADKNKVDNALKSLNIGDDEITLIFTEKNLGDLVFDYTKTLRLVFYKEVVPYVNDETVDVFRIAIKVAYTGTDVRSSVIYTSEAGWDPVIDERIFIEGINLVDNSEANSEIAEIVKDFIFVSNGRHTSNIDDSVIYRVRDEIGTYSLHQLINGTWRKICYSTDEIDNLIDVLTFGDLEESYPYLPSSNNASKSFVQEEDRKTLEESKQYTDSKKLEIEGNITSLTNELKEYTDAAIATLVGEYAEGELDETLDQLVEVIREIRSLKENNPKLDTVLNHAADVTSNPHKVTKEQVGLGNVVNVESYAKTETYSSTEIETKIGEEISSSFETFTTEVITPMINETNESIDTINNNINDNLSTKIEVAALGQELRTAINGKVSVEDGKGLSTNDFTNEHKEAVESISSTIDSKIEANNEVMKHIVDIDRFPEVKPLSGGGEHEYMYFNTALDNTAVINVISTLPFPESPTQDDNVYDLDVIRIRTGSIDNNPGDFYKVSIRKVVNDNGEQYELYAGTVSNGSYQMWTSNKNWYGIKLAKLVNGETLTINQDVCNILYENKIIFQIGNADVINSGESVIYRYNGNLYHLQNLEMKPINTEYIESVEELGELMLEQQEVLEGQIANCAKANAVNTFTKLNTTEDNIALKTMYDSDGVTVDSSKTRIYPTVNDTGMVGAPNTHFKQGFINQIGSNQLLPLNKTGESFADNIGEIGNSSNRWKNAFINNVESNKIKTVNANNIYTLFSGDSIKIEIPNQDDIDNPINYITINKDGITINGKKAITEITEDMLGEGLKLDNGKICLDLESAEGSEGGF